MIKVKPSTSKAESHVVATKEILPSSASINAQDPSQIPSKEDLSSKTTAEVLTASLDRLKYQSDAAFTKTTEDEGDRAMRRINAEERDTKLRDEKLLSLVRPQEMRHSDSQGQDTEPSMPLTEENIEKLSHEQDGDSVPRRIASPDQESATNFSSIANQPPSRSESRAQARSRPILQDLLHRESEPTALDRSMR